MYICMYVYVYMYVYHCNKLNNLCACDNSNLTVNWNDNYFEEKPQNLNIYDESYHRRLSKLGHVLKESTVERNQI